MKKGIVAAQWLWGIGAALGGLIIGVTHMEAVSAPQEASGMATACAVMICFYVAGRASELSMHKKEYRSSVRQK